MNEIIENNFKINYNNNQKDKCEIVSDLGSEENYPFSKDYSLEEIDNKDILKYKKINIDKLESLRLSQTIDNTEPDPQILLDRMAGEKQPNILQNIRKNIIDYNFQKILKENEYKINIIKTINTNKGLDADNDKNIYKENNYFYPEEYEKNNIKDNQNNNNEKLDYIENYEELTNQNYIKNKNLLRQQNELFVQLLNNNEDNTYKKRMISNLNEDLNNITPNNKSQRWKKLKNDDKSKNAKQSKNLSKYNSLKKLKNRIINKTINKITTKNIKSNKCFINGKIKESNNYLKNNNKLAINHFVNKKNNISTKAMNLKNKKLKKFCHHNFNLKKKRNKIYLTNENSFKKSKNIKKNIIIENLLNVKPTLKRNKSVKSIFMTDKTCDNSKTGCTKNKIQNNNYQNESIMIKKENKFNNKNKNISKENNYLFLKKNLTKNIYNKINQQKTLCNNSEKINLLKISYKNFYMNRIKTINEIKKTNSFNNTLKINFENNHKNFTNRNNFKYMLYYNKK